MYAGAAEWVDLDRYFEERLIGADAALEGVLTANEAAGLPPQDVSPLQGQFLHLVARMIGARRVLEIGTGGGYSTVWLARAVGEGGEVVTLEADLATAAVAMRNFAAAGVTERVSQHAGAPALETLAMLQREGLLGAPFDLIFIDADKPNNPAYLDWSLKLARPGTVIIGDNVVRNGAVSDPQSTDDRVQGVRSFLDMIAAEPRLTATALQTVGAKGWDGFVMALVS